MPTDKEINEAAARAIGLEPKFVDIGHDGYYTVNLRGPGMGSTPWNPLKHASQSQLLQANLLMAVQFEHGGRVWAQGRPMGKREVVHGFLADPQPGGLEATLRHAIAQVAYQCHTMEAAHATGS